VIVERYRGTKERIIEKKVARKPEEILHGTKKK
jgi:hypothetical protein